MINKIIGNLKIVSEIGKGGMGVYLAEHVKLNKRFAVKSLNVELSPDSLFRHKFIYEAKYYASLQHPNIVQVTDFIEHEDRFFLIMEYVEGFGLDELIKTHGKLSEEQALLIFKQILEGLNFLHSKGLIHGDVKPSNILVESSNKAKIMDFGLAFFTGKKRMTALGSNIGSPLYMSPEQIMKPRWIDHRTDVYSMGIVLYEMLTGEVPFDSDTESDFEIKNKHINAPVSKPQKKNPLILNQLSELISKALQKNPDNRFIGCGEFLEYIKAYEKEEMASKS